MTTAAVDSMFNTMELLRKQKNAGFEDEQARKKAKWDDEDRAIKADERKRAEELRTQLQADAAPVEVEEVEQAGPLQPDAAPMPAMSQIKGKTFASRELADKAATEQNAPQAVMQRQSMTALRAGNPEGAARVMETGMKLGEAERKIAHEAFQRRVDGTFAWGDLAKVLDEAGDPNMKGRFRPSEDGKTMVMERVNPDSSVEKLTEFPNTTEGFAKARAIARGMTAEQLFKHEDLVQAREDALAQRKAEGEQRHKEHLERMAAIRASRAGGGAGAGGEVDPEAKLKDRRDALGDFEKLLPPLSDDATPADRAARTQLLDEADAVFELNAQNGLVLTAPQIRAAMAADQSKTQTIRDTKTGRMFRVASVNGRRVIVGVVSGQKPQEQPPAPAAEAPRPAQVTDRGLPAYASRGAPQPGTFEYEVSMAALREKQRAGSAPNPDAPRRPIGFGTVN